MTDQPRFEGGQHAAEGKVPALIAWALYALTIPSGNLLVLIGLIVAYASRASATGVARAHIDSQIRLFWSVFWWTLIAWTGIVISFVLSFIIIGIPFLAIAVIFWLLLGVWFTVKSVLGLIALLGDKAP